MRICAFGSSSRDLDALYIDAAYELGRTLAEHGHGLVFGGYDVGLMGAVAHGVGDTGGSVIGVVTEGLNKKGRPVYPCTELICESDLATRKTRMTSLADAFVTLPGGLGTFDEFFDIVSQVKAGELDAKSAILNVGGFRPAGRDARPRDRHGPQLYRLAQQLRRVRLPRAADGVAGSVRKRK